MGRGDKHTAVIYLGHHVIHELLSSKARLHRHDQSHVYLVGPWSELFYFSTRLNSQPNLEHTIQNRV